MELTLPVDSPSGAARVSKRVVQKEATRTRIIAAARDLFEEHGYSTPSIGDISAAAGVTRATFYAHFSDKGACLEAVYEVMLTRDQPDWGRLCDALLARSRADIAAWISHAVQGRQASPALSAAWEQARVLREISPRQVEQALGEQMNQLSAFFNSVEGEQERAQVSERVLMLVRQLGQMTSPQFLPFSSTDALVSFAVDTWCGALNISR